MQRLLLLFAVIGACVPSQRSVFEPVDHEVERRVGVGVAWDARTSAAITALLEKPIDRDAAVRIALATNRRLQAEYDKLGIAAAEIADATVLHPLEVEVKAKLENGDIHELEIDAIQDIMGLLQMPQRRSAAHADLEAARARAVRAAVELVANVELAYLDVVAAQQQLELWQTALDAAAASAEIAERQHAAGNISQLALARERDQRAQATVDVTRAEVEVRVARAAFENVLGLGGDVKWTIAGRLADLPAAAPVLDTLETDALATSLEISALRAEKSAAEDRRGIARVRSVLPALGVGVAADRQDDEWAVGPAIAIGIPLFDQQQGPRARANAEIKRARNEEAATAIAVRAHARAVRERVAGAYAEAKQLHDVVVPQRQLIVNETLKQYNAMNASTFELLSARRELVDAGRQLIDATRRFWRASADARALARGVMLGSLDDAAMSAPEARGGH
jgi:cobalt-zinc-cadmium efflux system outer membrane protein